MNTNLLVVHPEDPATVPDTGAVVAALAHIGVVDAPFDFEGVRHWRPGGNFLDHVTFLGCSPVIATEGPGANGDFCHVGLNGPHQRQRFLGGTNVKPPRCPQCRYRIEEWRPVVHAWHLDPFGHSWHCPACGQSSAAPRLHWRHCAGFGRFFVEVWGVFEGEAVPGDGLLTALSRVNGAPWAYFYLRR